MRVNVKEIQLNDAKGNEHDSVNYAGKEPVPKRGVFKPIHLMCLTGLRMPQAAFRDLVPGRRVHASTGVGIGTRAAYGKRMLTAGDSKI